MASNKKEGVNPLNFVYHEKQLKGTLMCGQHVLNALLQGPYFGAEELAKIAADLDEKERELISDHSGYANLLPQHSTNVDESGNFSIQVLRVALEQHDLKVDGGEELEKAIKGLSSSEKEYDENEAPAFLCHLDAHWFAIRYLNGSFWDLNSLYKKPQKISNFHLMAYLGQLKNDGWSIFLVHGIFPPPIRNKTVGIPSSWFEIGKDDNIAENEDNDKIGKFDQEGEDEELQAALMASLEQDQEKEFKTKSGQNEDDDDKDLQAAIALSLYKEETKD